MQSPPTVTWVWFFLIFRGMHYSKSCLCYDFSPLIPFWLRKLYLLYLLILPSVLLVSQIHLPKKHSRHPNILDCSSNGGTPKAFQCWYPTWHSPKGCLQLLEIDFKFFAIAFHFLFWVDAANNFVFVHVLVTGPAYNYNFGALFNQKLYAGPYKSLNKLQWRALVYILQFDSPICVGQDLSLCFNLLYGVLGAGFSFTLGVGANQICSTLGCDISAIESVW